MSKNIRKPRTEKKSIFKNKMGIKLATIALALGIGSCSINSIINKMNNTMTVAITKDIQEDEYKNSIPIFSDSDGKTILTTVSGNKLILTEDVITERSHPKPLHLVYVMDDNNKMVTGYTYIKYMEQYTHISKENASSIYKTTAKNGLILRDAPTFANNKLASIPEGSILIGGQAEKSDLLWTNVVYFNGSTITKGVVTGKYLEDITNANNIAKSNDISKDNSKNIPNTSSTTKINDISKNNENSIDSTEKNNNKNYNKDKDIKNANNENSIKEFDIYSPKDNAFGIDVSFIEPKILDKLLKGEIAIPKTVTNRQGKKINISKFNRKIDFVYIRAQGTNPYLKELTAKLRDNYIELAKVCENNKIPFGFYCYSTCKNADEAKLEYQIFSNALKSVNSASYNLLPLVIDVESAAARDRHYTDSHITEITNAKIDLANMLEKDFGKTMLYTSRGTYNDSLKSKFLDLKQYQNGLISGNSHIWHVTPINSKTHQESLQTISDSNFVTTNQIALDIRVGKNINNLVDINLMNKEALNHYITGKYAGKYVGKYNRNYVALNDVQSKKSENLIKDKKDDEMER